MELFLSGTLWIILFLQCQPTITELKINLLSTLLVIKSINYSYLSTWTGNFINNICKNYILVIAFYTHLSPLNILSQSNIITKKRMGNAENKINTNFIVNIINFVLYFIFVKSFKVYEISFLKLMETEMIILNYCIPKNRHWHLEGSPRWRTK